MNRRQKRTKSSFFVLLYPFSGLPRLLLYIKSQISGVRQTGALLSTALYLGVLLDVLPLFSNILLYMFLYFSAFSFIIWTLWPTEYYYHHLSIVLSFLSILLFSATRADFSYFFPQNISIYRCRLLLISAHSIASSLKICNNGNDLLLFKSWEICILWLPLGGSHRLVEV